MQLEYWEKMDVAEAGSYSMLDLSVLMKQHAQIGEGLAAFQMLTSHLPSAVIVSPPKTTTSVLGMLTDGGCGQQGAIKDQTPSASWRLVFAYTAAAQMPGGGRPRRPTLFQRQLTH